MSYASAAGGAREVVLERRDSPRVALRARATVELCSGYGSLPAWVSDIGTGGACLDAETSITLSEIEKVRIEHDGQVLDVEARGRWARIARLDRSWHVGIQFAEVSAEQRTTIMRLLRSATESVVSFLRESSELGDLLTYDEVLDVAHCTRFREVGAGTHVWRGGSARETTGSGTDSFFVTRMGTILIGPETSRSRSILERVHEGSVFGGIGLVIHNPPKLSAVAAVDSVLLEVDAASFEFLQRARPRTAARISELIMEHQACQFAEALRRLESE